MIRTMIFFFITLTLLKNLNKLLRSLAQGEVVQFDVVMSTKNMPKAANITRPNFRTVQGSKHAPHRWPRYSQQFKRQQRPQQKDHIVNGYGKLRNQQHFRRKPNSYKNRQSLKSNHEVKTANIR